MADKPEQTDPQPQAEPGQVTERRTVETHTVETKPARPAPEQEDT